MDIYPETSANPARLRQIQNTPGRHTQDKQSRSAHQSRETWNPPASETVSQLSLRGNTMSEAIS